MNGRPVKYLRPLDRSQDKYFEKLASKNQSSVTALRIALEKTKSRISLLKDANIVKDEVIEEERILRKAAEDRLDKVLVDLYENPEVNSELRQRLPYANKSDPMIKGMKTDMFGVEEFDHSTQRGMELDKLLPVKEIHQNERLDVVTNSSTQELISVPEAATQRSTSSSSTQTNNTLIRLAEEQPALSSPTSHQRSISPEPRLTDSWVSDNTHSSHTATSAITTAASSSAVTPTALSPITPSSTLLSVSTASVPYMLPMGPLSSSASSVASFAALPQPRVYQVDSVSGLNPPASASFAALPQPRVYQDNSVSGLNPPASASVAFLPQTQAHGHVSAYGLDPQTSKNFAALHQREAHGQSSAYGLDTQTSKNFAALHQPQAHGQVSAYGLNPLTSASFASLAASSYIDLPNNHASKVSEESNSHRSSFAQNQPEMGNISSVSQSGSPVEASSTTHFAPSTFGVNIQPLYINPFPLAKTPSVYSQRTAPDNVSHISRLLAEIATLKKEKQELSDQLKASEQKCEELRLGIGTPEAKNSQDLGALIEEIRAAEKVRDQTVKKVVQTAEEDKERTRKKENNRRKEENLHKVLSDSELSGTEDDGSSTASQSSQVSEVGETKEVTGSGVNEEVADPRPTLEDLTEMMQRQRQIMAEELQKVIDERNEARRSVIKLENKLAALELRPRSDRKVEELIATLSVVRRERDLAVAKLKSLMSEVAETKLVYSLHKALWREDMHNETSSSEPTSKLTNRDQPAVKNNNNNTFSSNISKHEDVDAKLMARLAFSDQERQLQSQRIKELEQMVKRQRQKLNVLCAGPMLMDGCIETE
ncbi:mirror-image polydactyly 1-like [Elysia marginata]|uniref:Mirror-image polydactyly 1-like n=1 Tax=Elysia marginata TaxID=1093978 RepID=A0AAV4II63_9GAST|nr:mirror-image polydactyly 1-like [Elysia marginata]